MTIFHMDKTYMKGSRNRLYDANDIEYLDYTSQYGALPLGYNPEEIWRSIKTFNENQYPSMCQPSAPFFAEELAIQLTNLFVDDLNICTFAQSGAESVEAAIKLARAHSKKKRKFFLVTKVFMEKHSGPYPLQGKKCIKNRSLFTMNPILKFLTMIFKAC